MSRYGNGHSSLTRSITLVAVCLFLVNAIDWADPSGSLNPPQTINTTLAAESRLKPFFEKHGLDFRNLAAVIYAAGKLRDLYVL